jgi:hypothetical protein
LASPESWQFEQKVLYSPPGLRSSRLSTSPPPEAPAGALAEALAGALAEALDGALEGC